MAPISYWKQGALGAAGVRDGLQLGRSARAAASGVERAGAYRVATRTGTACWYWFLTKSFTVTTIRK